MSGHRSSQTDFNPPTRPARLRRSACGRSSSAWRGAAILFLALWVVSRAVVACGGEVADGPAKDESVKQRLELMRNAIDDFQVRTFEAEPAEPLKFCDRPLLRYDDQTRPGDGAQALLDATAWRLGETGRPRAIVTFEIYPINEARAVMTYEFVSLSPLALEMKNSRGLVWRPASTELKMAPLPEAPKPGDAKRARLAQMRKLARRVDAQADWRGEKVECRLLSQPIDRYDDAAAGVVDGAIFVFANGTNPEMGLILECSEERWSYGVFRLTAATLFAELDGKSFDLPPKPTGNPVEAPYAGMRLTIDLPE